MGACSSTDMTKWPSDKQLALAARRLSTMDNIAIFRQLAELPPFASAVAASWDADTAVEPAAWSLANPAVGQCAVTAVIVQDYFGGDIWRSRVDGVSHYFNVVDGIVIDLTRQQFSPRAIEIGRAPSTRDYVLSFEATRRRYDRLRARVAARLPS